MKTCLGRGSSILRISKGKYTESTHLENYTCAIKHQPSKTVKESIMANKICLHDRRDLSGIWINHDEATLVRRAKGRARHIASFARNTGTSVLLGPRGITLDNVFYSIDKLDTILSIYIRPNTLTIPISATWSANDVNNSQLTGTTVNAHSVDTIDNTQVPGVNTVGNVGYITPQSNASLPDQGSVLHTGQTTLPLPTWQNRPPKPGRLHP